VETDDSEFRTAIDGLVDPLEALKANLAQIEAEREALINQIPKILATHEEAALFGGPGAEEARAAVEAHQSAIEAVKERLKITRATLNRERFSSTLATRAEGLFDIAADYRNSLLELAPAAWRELDRAQAAYLKVVAKVGELGRKIARVEEVMMDGARPFMAEKPHMDLTPPAMIIIDPGTIQKIYDPDGKPTITGAAALHQPEPNADSVLEILKKEDSR
jgi:hypothetical protein